MSAGTSKAADKDSGVVARAGESIRETIESIVVAFILAFVFRAFIVEAFVIPTGSMAATLYGEHATHTCTDCGWEYAYGRLRDREERLYRPPPKSTCPNCGFSDETLSRESDPPDAGDRILVLKWPFDIGGKWLGPKRWEVTVFKDPADGKTNFIKRLVGCPNEVLEIIDGDIYTAPVAKLPRDLVQRLDEIRHLNYRRLQIQVRADALNYDDRQIMDDRTQVNSRLAELQPQVAAELDGHLQIQRKLPETTRAQESLWLVVFDQDYLPTQRSDVGWEPYPPGASTAWQTSTRTICFNGLQRGNEAIRLTGRPAYDFCAYNGDGDRSAGRPMVADRRLRCLFTPLAGDGRFRMRLTKYTDDFVAEINPAEGMATLTMTSRPTKAKPQSFVIGAKPISLPLGKSVELELVNVDYRVSLRVNGEELVASKDAMYRPNITWLRNRPVAEASASTNAAMQPVAELSAERLDLELRHVVLERDEYYTSPTLCSEETDRERKHRNPFCLDSGLHGRGGGLASAGWGTEGNPILLRDKEYFMLGDNSPASKDSRLWWEVGPHLVSRGEAYQLGTVPEDQLVGRAFFVYWPSGFRPWWAMRIALVPNVGEMRWIR